MIEKSVSAPSCTRTTLNFSASSLKQGGKVKRVRLSHMKEESGVFVCAEAIVPAQMAPFDFDRFFVLPDEYIFTKNAVHKIFLFRKNLTVGIPENVLCAAPYYNQQGEEGLLLLCRNNLYRLNGKSFAYCNSTGGTCCAMHNERFYIGKVRRLYYSAAMDMDNWINSTYGSGYIDFPEDGGEILGLASLKEKLFIFRETETAMLTAHADPLEFHLTALPFRFGANIASTMSTCGDAVYFFTEQGLCVLDSAGNCKRAENADDEDIDLTKPVAVTSCSDKYYAIVFLKSGERMIYCYDTVCGRGYYINHNCFAIGSNQLVYVTSGRTFYQLKGKSMPTNGECAFMAEFSLGGNWQNTYLEWVSLEGTGKFTVSVENQKGNSVTLKGDVGKRMILPVAMKGEEFRIKLVPEDEDFCIQALSLGVRRDSYGN